MATPDVVLMESDAAAAAKPSVSTAKPGQPVEYLSVGQSSSFPKQNTQAHLQEMVFITPGHLTLKTCRKPHLASAPQAQA